MSHYQTEEQLAAPGASREAIPPRRSFARAFCSALQQPRCPTCWAERLWREQEIDAVLTETVLDVFVTIADPHRLHDYDALGPAHLTRRWPRSRSIVSMQ
jgi:hypothetical protein